MAPNQSNFSFLQLIEPSLFMDQLDLLDLNSIKSKDRPYSLDSPAHPLE